METVAPGLSFVPDKSAARRRRISAEAAIKSFFGSNALVAIVVLALITIFLFREGFGFFGQNLANLRLYRRAGLEYVDIIRTQAENFTALSRQLSNIRLEAARAQPDSSTLQKFDEFATRFSDAGDQLNSLVSDSTDQGLALREAMLRAGSAPGAGSTEDDARDERESAAPVDPVQGMVALRTAQTTFAQIIDSMKGKVDALLAQPAPLSGAQARQSFAKWKTDVQRYLQQLPAALQKLRAWNPDEPVPAYRAVTSFLFGTSWVTASFWQDWYGIIPLFVGSLMVAVVALVIAVPLGVSGAIYVSEVASPVEKSLIKPYIEFISRNSVCGAWLFRHRRAWRGGARSVASVFHAMGAFFPDP